MLRATQRAFIAAYRECGNITLAAHAARTGRRSHYDWLDEDEYKTEFEDATEHAADLLIAEARRRAVEGVRRPVLYQGEPARDEKGKPVYLHEYSDNLLMFLIKGARPNEYRDNAKVEHTGAGGAPLAIEVTFVRPNAS